jgi:hypothetical protein
MKTPQHMIRDKNQIIDEFNISDEYFNQIFYSYEQVLGRQPNIGLWNDDMEEYSRKIKALNEEEIQKAKYDLNQAILNRVIVRLSSELPTKPWWKFW